MTPSQFQSTPPRGGDAGLASLATLAANFNPRPLAGATQVWQVWQPWQLISIHAPSRGRHQVGSIFSFFFNFNPRPLAGATTCSLRLLLRAIFQSTPPRGGDATGEVSSRQMKISIHAPSRGRLRRQVDTMVDDISIHAPSRGRPCLFVIFALPAYFNPRPLAGATRQQADLRFSPEFQSTPPRGGDPNAISSSRPIARFQSTPPRGGDGQTRPSDSI